MSEFKQGGVAEGLYTQKEGELSVWAFLNNTGHHSYRGFLLSSCLRKISLRCPEREAAWCHGSIAAEDGWIPARTASCSMLSTRCYNVDSQSVWELKRAPNVKTLANHTKHWLQALKLLHISFKSEECSSNQELLEGKTFHTAVPPSVFKLSWLMLLKLSLFTRYLWFLYFLSKIRL